MEKSVKSKFVWICLLLGAMLMASTVLQAQPYGRVAGRVLATTGEYLIGANVFLKGTSMGATSDREGKYSIENVPAGTYTLTVGYIGYEAFSAEITVASGSTVQQEAKLKVSYLKGEEVVVRGLREGQIKALSQQRTSPGIENVVSEEQMQRFPDLNTADVLQRIPAISVVRDQGEGRYVQIRGTEARLSAVSVNGERITAPDGGERYVGMDVISATQAASIEVVKALTPDVDADAIGGSVNIITRSAFDSDKPFLHVQGGSGYSDQLGKPLWQGVFTYGTQLGAEKKIGLTVTGNYDYSKRSTWDNESTWDEAKTSTGATIPFALVDLDLRDYIVKRERWNVAGSLEFRPSANNQFFLRGMYNNRDDYEYRRRLYVRPSKGTFLDETHVSNAKVYNELKDRLERQNITSVSAGGIHNMGRLALDYTVAYSRGETKKPDETDPLFQMVKKMNITLDLTNTDTPQYKITSQGADYNQFNPGNFRVDKVKWNNDDATDKDVLGAVNLKYAYRLGSLPSELKFGGKMHMREKKKDQLRWIYEWNGSNYRMMTNFVGDTNVTIQNGAYKIGPTIDGGKFRADFKALKDNPAGYDGAIDQENTDAANFTADENIYAYYAMNTVTKGNLMALFGFRHEFTSETNKSNQVLLDVDGNYVSTTPQEAKKSYNNLMPMAHVRYRLTPMTNIRLAATTGIARPNFFDVVPYRRVLPEDEEVYEGNSTLKPTTATNLDLMAEHYFQGIGIISGGFFYKKLNNIIFTQTTKIRGGAYNGYDYFQPVNGGNSSLTGYELNWQQQLTFLPGFLSGLGLYANYTHTKSKAEVGGRLERPELPGQAADVANFAVSYEKYGFTGRFSVNYHGKFIEEVGVDAEHDRIYQEHLQMDFSASQKVYKGLAMYVEVLNLNKEPMIYYMGQKTRPIQREFYSWWMHGGVKFDM